MEAVRRICLAATRTRLYCACATALLWGCAMQPYSPISDADFSGPTLPAVRDAPDSYLGTRVRWGGIIAKVDNREHDTWVYIVEHALDSDGRPQDSLTSAGRFIGRVQAFLDPDVYTKGRGFTVVGKIEGPVRDDIGEYPYEYPVVAAQEYRLWAKPLPYQDYYYPYPPYYPYYDPFWGPRLYWPYGYRRPYY